MSDNLAEFTKQIQSWSVQQQKQARDLLVKTARDGHDRIMREQTMRAGYEPEFNAYANTPDNPDIETVILPGPIVYQYRYHNEIIGEALRMLDAASPVDSGDYKRGHILYVNGTPTHRDAKFQSGDDVMIVNVVPYARRIEVGKTKSGRDFLVQVPNRIYERVANQLNLKYGKVSMIEMDWVGVGQITVSSGQSDRTVKRGRLNIRKKDRRRGRGPSNLFPAILIKPRQ